jgi:hypothetical protein
VLLSLSVQQEACPVELERGLCIVLQVSKSSLTRPRFARSTSPRGRGALFPSIYPSLSRWERVGVRAERDTLIPDVYNAKTLELEPGN